MILTPKMEHGLILLMVLMVLVPCGLVIALVSEVPFREVPSDPAEHAVLPDGYTVTLVNSTTWSLPGSLGGKTYVLTDRNGNRIIVATQAFASAEQRDAAIRVYNANAIGRGRQIGGLIVHGQYIISVMPANPDIIRAHRAAVARALSEL
jgi:hypothetical protein